MAVVTALAWLLAIEVLPALHLAHHDHDHTHEANGAIVAGDDHHDHADSARPRHESSLALAIDEPGAAPHAAQGASHYAAASHTPATPSLDVAIRTPGLPAPLDVRVELRSTFLSRATARGPPSV